MKAEDLLEYGPEQLEALSDKQLEELFAKYFTVTRPALDINTKSKIEALTGIRATKTGTRAKSSALSRGQAQPDLMAALGSILSPEQMQSLANIKAPPKK